VDGAPGESSISMKNVSVPRFLDGSRSLCALTALLAIAVIWAYTDRPQTDRIKIVAEITGRISMIHVKEGDHVHTGDAILQLDTRDLLLKRRWLESKIHLTELRGDAARATLAALYSDLEQTDLELGRLTITSPRDGKITSTAALHVNEMISAGTLIAILIPISTDD
jgi:multidrug resistance efflux pump